MKGVHCTPFFMRATALDNTALGFVSQLLIKKPELQSVVATQKENGRRSARLWVRYLYSKAYGLTYR
jgi:hypothetical protein